MHWFENPANSGLSISTTLIWVGLPTAGTGAARGDGSFSTCRGVTLAKRRQTLAGALSEKSHLQNFIDLPGIRSRRPFKSRRPLKRSSYNNGN